MTQGNFNFYLDTLIVETVLGDPSIRKNSQLDLPLSGLGNLVKEYVGQHINEGQNKTENIINMLAPGAISMLFRGLGFGKIGFLFGVVASALHIDVASMLESLWRTVKSSLEQHGTISPTQIDGAVNQIISDHTQSDQSQSNSMLDKRNFNNELRNARLLRLSIEDYENKMLKLTKESNVKNSFSFISTAAGKRSQTASLLARILGWVFKVALMSAGVMVTGDIANKLLGRPNALDQSLQGGTSGGPAAAPIAPVTTQNKFKVNPSYQESIHPRPWVEQVPNNDGSIDNMLVQFTKQVYSGLDGKEDIIRNSHLFQAVKNQIIWYNHNSPGDNFIYIPPNYSSIKSIVDHYIDEVAKNAV